MKNPVLITANYVSNISEHVIINKKMIEEFVKEQAFTTTKNWLTNAPLDMGPINDLKLEDILNLLFIFNSVNFCYWTVPKWKINYLDRTYDGTWAMLAAFNKGIMNKIPIYDPKYISELNYSEFEHIFKGNGSLTQARERFQFMLNSAEILMDKFQGRFSNILSKGNYDTTQVMKIIIKEFPSYKDQEEYNGKTIFFNKRCQLLLSDIHDIIPSKFKSNIKYKNLVNQNKLTAFADYKVPMSLRALGILKYSPELSRKIDRMEEISQGSSEEIEIRANAIAAVHMMQSTINSTFAGKDKIMDKDINDMLWVMGQRSEMKLKPYHRTMTTSY